MVDQIRNLHHFLADLSRIHPVTSACLHVEETCHLRDCNSATDAVQQAKQRSMVVTCPVYGPDSIHNGLVCLIKEH